MAKAMRWFGYFVGGLFLLAIAAAAYVWIASSQALRAHAPRGERLVAPPPAQLADAPRQLHVLGCLSCHGDKLQGRVFIEEPGVGTVHASNLTLVASRATDQQLAQAIRQGIGHDGRALLIMPSEGYQFLTDSEVSALIAAIRRMPKTGVDQPLPRMEPLGRLGLAMGRFKSAPAVAAEFRRSQVPDFGPRYARGRHIVQINCAECHGPQLQGKEVEPGTVAPALSIAAAYDLDEFRKMIRTGIAPGNRKLGLMGEVARDDFRYLTDDEIEAIHAYLVERANRSP